MFGLVGGLLAGGVSGHVIDKSRHNWDDDMAKIGAAGGAIIGAVVGGCTGIYQGYAISHEFISNKMDMTSAQTQVEPSAAANSHDFKVIHGGKQLTFRHA